ncbi:MAG: M23 family metallopeptidase [Oscillospiraceae bacterium]|nr:M23 family metallopeptidase [Oscillospiraceae bacterium]
MKRRRNEKQNVKLIGAASVLGAAAVAVAVFAAYRTTTNRLIPTGTTSTYTYSSSNKSDVPVQNNISNVPIGSSKPSSDKSSTISSSSKPSAVETNKPVTVEIGNIMPVEGEVSHPFSNGEMVKSETLGVWKTHDGCDILCDVGTDVKSMSEGTVKMIDSSSIWGVCVTVEQSNGLEVRYCGLAKELNVKAGAAVKQGEILGKTGDTNQAEMLQQPHLHLAVKRGGKWIDPMSVIDK